MDDKFCHDIKSAIYSWCNATGVKLGSHKVKVLVNHILKLHLKRA